MYTFSPKDDPNQIYKFKFYKLYQMGADGNTVGYTTVALASLTWDFFKDTTEEDVFWITASNGQSTPIDERLPCNSLQFRTKLQTDSLKFDVIMDNTVLKDTAASLILEWRLFNFTDTTSDGTRPCEVTMDQVCFYGPDGTKSSEVCFEVSGTATVTNPTTLEEETIDVAVSFREGFVQLNYPKFEGDLLHDPELTTDLPAPRKGCICFSGRNLVDVQGKGAIPMENLEIGDIVKTSADGKFSRVYSFAHKDRQSEAEFLQIYTEKSSLPVEISPEHFVYVGSDQEQTLLRTKHVQVGDRLGDTIVTAITPVQRHGLYAPVTESGEILVSGIVASSYASLLDVNPNAQTWATHSILSFLRFACTLDFSICTRETYTEDGFSTHLFGMIQVAHQLAKLDTSMQWFLVILASPVLMAILSLVRFGFWVGVWFMGLLLADRYFLLGSRKAFHFHML
jgi:hypothetical protein